MITNFSYALLRRFLLAIVIWIFKVFYREMRVTVDRNVVWTGKRTLLNKVKRSLRLKYFCIKYGNAREEK